MYLKEIALIVMVSIGSAAVVTYLSNTVHEDLTVSSPHEQLPCDTTSEDIIPPVTPTPSPTPEQPIEKRPSWLGIYYTIDFSHGRHCSDYSKLTTKKLRKEGYDAYCYSLRNEGIKGHIMVFIFDEEDNYVLEPQTGQYWKYGSTAFESYIFNLLGYNPEIRTIWLPNQ